MPIRFSVMLMLMLMLFAEVASGVTLGQIDQFGDGTSGWIVGGGKSVTGPTAIPSGGPMGDTDAFLRYATDAVNTGGRFLIMNKSQWGGDYLAADVTGVSAIARNAGSIDLEMRLLLEGPGGGFFSETSTLLPVGGDWQTMFFPISADALVGGDDLTQTLTTVNQVRIFHNPEPSFPGPFAVDAAIEIDAIQAVPEPSTLWLGSLGLGCWLLTRRCRRCPAGN